MNRTGRLHGLALGLLIGCATPSFGADSSPLERISGATAAAASGLRTGEPSGRNMADKDAALPMSPDQVVLSDPAGKKAYLDAMQRYFEYRATGYAYRTRVFEWQLLSSRAIFIVVLLLVLSGVYFAAVQFHVALREAGRAHIERPAKQGDAAGVGSAAEPATGPVATPAGVAMLASKVAASSSGVTVESSVLGVVILALSLAFFYLYLVYVYPIVNVF